MAVHVSVVYFWVGAYVAVTYTGCPAAASQAAAVVTIGRVHACSLRHNLQQPWKTLTQPQQRAVNTYQGAIGSKHQVGCKIPRHPVDTTHARWCAHGACAAVDWRGGVIIKSCLL